MKYLTLLFSVVSVVIAFPATAQIHHSESRRHATASAVPATEAQALFSNAKRLVEALRFLGSAMAPADETYIHQLEHQLGNGAGVIEDIQRVLDPYCLATVHMNPEGRVMVDRGPAAAVLIQGGWSTFLVKVINETGATPPLFVESPHARQPYHAPSYEARVDSAHRLSKGEVLNRFAEVLLYQERPMFDHLSGARVEYAIVQLYCKDAGKREIELGFHVGQGSQDIGFRNTIAILFESKPAVKVRLAVKDDDGSPTMGSFIFSDHTDRGGEFTTIFPLPARRVAAYDEFPDFFFQPQVYRADGEHVYLPPGSYRVTYARGPEYVIQEKEITVPPGADSIAVEFALKRWINLNDRGWYSSDHHIHASGCSHYDSPEEGVEPEQIWRQIQGEALNMGSILTWGPGWYHQKQYFSGTQHPLSDGNHLMRYDVEVSGFPSSHAGHLVLLNLREDDYPGTKEIEDWPSWTLPVLKWGKDQGGLVGYAHSGWGLSPQEPTDDLPNYVTPKMDWIGANEYVVTVAHGLVDFYSAGDTPPEWELNMWYHTLNCGFKPRLSGETDFPCITDERVALARSYFKADELTYAQYIHAMRVGRSYVSDGRSHVLNFRLNGVEVGTEESLVALDGAAWVHITADVTAYLPEEPTAADRGVGGKDLSEKVYWHLEKARVGTTRQVYVELVVNGYAVDTVAIEADGKSYPVSFDYKVDRSSWAALRIFPSSHTNPIFVEVGGQPIAEPQSAAWCLKALEQCWKMKAAKIRPEEKAEARAAYDKAREVYQAIQKKGN